MKGTFKAGVKYISSIFVVKEEEIEIGLPTDVKHVAHIGFDGQSAAGTAPTWMKEFKTGPDFTASSIDNTSSKPSSQAENGGNPTKKPKRKKPKAMSSSSSNASSRATSSRATSKSKAKLVEDDNPNPADIQVI